MLLRAFILQDWEDYKCTRARKSLFVYSRGSLWYRNQRKSFLCFCLLCHVERTRMKTLRFFTVVTLRPERDNVQWAGHYHKINPGLTEHYPASYTANYQKIIKQWFKNDLIASVVSWPVSRAEVSHREVTDCCNRPTRYRGKQEEWNVSETFLSIITETLSK